MSIMTKRYAEEPWYFADVLRVPVYTWLIILAQFVAFMILGILGVLR